MDLGTMKFFMHIKLVHKYLHSESRWWKAP
jgi:hypothetical protein